MSRRAEAAWILVLGCQLLLVWSHPIFATQDGATHLANAVALRDWNVPGARYAELFEPRSVPVPNWTTHLALAALALLTHPLVAEKIWVSVCLVGFAVGARLFLRASGAGPWAVAFALLFALSRGLWLGFYNAVLAAGLALAFLSWCSRPTFLADRWRALLACGALLVLYFTHLTGWVLALAGAVLVGLVESARTDRLRKARRLILAAAPTIIAEALFMAQPRDPDALPFRRILKNAWRARESAPDASLFVLLPPEWFPHPANPWLLAALVVGVLGFLVATSLWSRPREGSARLRTFGLLAGIAATLWLAFGPVDLGPDHGFIPTRIALLAPVLLLAWTGWPLHRVASTLLLAVVLVLHGFALSSDYRFLSRANADLREFTAGRARVGAGRTLVMLRGIPRDRDVDYANLGLYCLDTGNVDVGNYEAGTGIFPLRYRPGVRLAVREMLNGRRPFWTDAVVAWNNPKGPLPSPDEYEEVLSQARLRVWLRRSRLRGNP